MKANKAGNKGALPSALAEFRDIAERLGSGKPAIFLDYDGTLTAIVDDPARAFLPRKTKKLLRTLSAYWPVVILSGRAMDDVIDLVALDNLVYAGSHGFNITGPEGSYHIEQAERVLPSLAKAGKECEEALKDLEGIRLERKPYAIAVHYRQAADDTFPVIQKRMKDIAGRYPELALTTGKKIFELRPQADWNKGKALHYLMEKLHLDDSAVPVYIGDDTTDEDAFEAIAGEGVGILVADHDQPTEAQYVLESPEEVAVFLQKLITLAKQESVADAWSLVYDEYIPEKEKLHEALCTLGNGYFASRGAAPESVAGERHYPGTYIAGLYNRLTSTVAGHTVENESIVNAPNWLPLGFRIEDDDWFDPDSVTILEYRQELNMKQGVLTRTVVFEDGKQRRTRLIQRRFVHMSYSHHAGLETTIQPENWTGSLHVRSAIDGRVDNTLVKRYRQLNNHHLNQLDAGVTDDGLIWLQVETNQSHIRISETARTRIFIGGRLCDIAPSVIRNPGYIGQDFKIRVGTETPVRIEKIASIYHSRDSALSESLLEAQEALRHAGSFQELLDRHILSWNHLWQRWRIRVETENPRVERILNLHIFHLLQSVSLNTIGLDAGVTPRGLHGEAYRGLIMWDELFIFPLLNLRIPDITRSLLMYRYRRMPRAVWAAEEAGCRGAMFPWQSGSDGREQAQSLHLNPESGRWIPDNTQLQRHINIAIAYNIWQYYQVTGDQDFMSFYGAELIIGIARFWASKVSYNPSLDRYEICRVMGPDEFHDRYPGAEDPGIDNNAYTNVMVSWILWRAIETLESLPKDRRKFIMEDYALDDVELKQWDDISRNLRIVFHDDGIISQFEGYGELKEFEWDEYKKKYGNIHRLDRILESEGDSPNRYKLSKQADVLMLFYLLSADELRELFERLGYPFSYETIPSNISYYLKRTSHGSTLSHVVHAWVLARSNREMSWDLFQDALESDISDIQGGTTHEGIHLGAMAGTVDLMLRCYSGIESRGETIWFNPRLPSELGELAFGIRYRKCSIDVHITAERIILYSRPCLAAPVKVGYEDKTYELMPGQTIELDI